MNHICVICKKEFEGYGNNASPIAIGQCCDECNARIVIPTRIKDYDLSVKNLTEELIDQGCFI